MKLDKEILVESFDALKPVMSEVVDKFHENLLLRHPSCAGFFSADRLESQKKAIEAGIVEVLQALADEAATTRLLKDFGQAAATRGVGREHYDWFAESLLGTLQFFFADTWTERLEDAWMVLLGFATETMSPAKPRAAADEAVEMRERIESALREAMKAALQDLSQDPEIRKAARDAATQLIKESVEQGLSDLKSQLKNRRAA